MDDSGDFFLSWFSDSLDEKDTSTQYTEEEQINNEINFLLSFEEVENDKNCETTSKPKIIEQATNLRKRKEVHENKPNKPKGHKIKPLKEIKIGEVLIFKGEKGTVASAKNANNRCISYKGVNYKSYSAFATKILREQDYSEKTRPVLSEMSTSDGNTLYDNKNTD